MRDTEWIKLQLPGFWRVGAMMSCVRDTFIMHKINGCICLRHYTQ